jgi:plasmid stabilization system protein ParE
MTSVVIVDAAEEQLGEIDAWWKQNQRAAPTLVMDELARCVRLLESSPDIGVRFHRSAVPGVRRLLMRKTRHLIYYIHDATSSIVYIIAIWGAPKEGDPVLHDPRP